MKNTLIMDATSFDYPARSLTWVVPTIESPYAFLLLGRYTAFEQLFWPQSQNGQGKGHK